MHPGLREPSRNPLYRLWAGESPPFSREAGTFRTMRSDHAFRTMGESEGPTPLHLPSIDRSPKAIRPFLICAWSLRP